MKKKAFILHWEIFITIIKKYLLYDFKEGIV